MAFELESRHLGQVVVVVPKAFSDDSTAKKADVKRCIYASSCSVYGYTTNELYGETRPVASAYPYGISTLQGEQAVVKLMDDRFSGVSLSCHEPGPE